MRTFACFPNKEGHFKVSGKGPGNKKRSCSHVSDRFAFPRSCWPRGFMLEMLIALSFAIAHPLIVYRNLQFTQIPVNHSIHTSICPHMLCPGTPPHIYTHESLQDSRPKSPQCRAKEDESSRSSVCCHVLSFLLPCSHQVKKLGLHKLWNPADLRARRSEAKGDFCAGTGTAQTRQTIAKKTGKQRHKIFSKDSTGM